MLKWKGSPGSSATFSTVSTQRGHWSDRNPAAQRASDLILTKAVCWRGVPAGVTSLRRDMVRLHFEECSRITEAGRRLVPLAGRQHLTRRPAGAPGAIGITSLTAGVVCKKRSAMDQHNNRS